MFRNKRNFGQFLRFCTVGLANTAVDFAVFFLLNMAGIPYLPAQAISYSAGITNSFFINRKWTFHVTHKANILEASNFIMVNGLSLLVSSGILAVLYDMNHLNLWLCKVIATGAGVLINFMGNRLWVFADSQKTRDEIS